VIDSQQVAQREAADKSVCGWFPATADALGSRPRRRR